MNRPTDVEKMESICQFVGPYEFEKTDKYFVVNNVKLHIYTTGNNLNYYVSIKDYCQALGARPDGGFFMRALKYPDIVLAHDSKSIDTKACNVFFLNLEGCEKYITSKRYMKYRTIKVKIHEAFNKFMNDLDTKEEQQSVKQQQEFKMFEEETFDDTNTLNQECDSEQHTESIEHDVINDALNSVKTYVDTLKNDIHNLQEENAILKQENQNLKNKPCSIDMEKINNLTSFITECEKSTEPFSNRYILDALTIILDKAIQEHISCGGGRLDFICGFNSATNRNTMYKDQPKEYLNEPFVRIAMRLYGYEVIHFGLNHPVYKDYILHQLKNMFGINITQNKFVLGMILGLLTRKVEPSLVGTQICTNITFNIPQV